MEGEKKCEGGSEGELAAQVRERRLFRPVRVASNAGEARERREKRRLIDDDDGGLVGAKGEREGQSDERVTRGG